MHKSVHRILGRTRATVLSAALLSGAALPAAGLWAGPASALPLPLTTTTLSSSHNPSFYGQPVTFTAVVAPKFFGIFDGGGTVGFKNGLSTISGCSAATLHHIFGTWRAFCTTSTLPAGLDSIRATYSGDTHWAGSFSSSLTQVVLKAPTHLTADITFNFLQTFTVHGTLDSFGHPVAFQLLRFSVGPFTLCHALTNFHGTASCVLSYAQSLLIRQNAGRFLVTYGGSGNYLPSFAFGQGIILP